ncbi:tail assembly protein [Vibrio phage vB_VpS_CA8]|nr:tail assembly protein [Vibrio phage vB_VpS_CA8]
MAVVHIFGKGVSHTLTPEPPLPTATPVVAGGNSVLAVGASAKNKWATSKGFATLGFVVTGPWQCLKNSVFLTPTRVDLGVSADVAVREFDMWHTFLQPLTISNIVQVGTRGMTLTREGAGTKDLIPALGRAKYTLNVGLQTETIIDATYTWKTSPSVKNAQIRITGSRVVPWPYLPKGDFVETREWLTDVIRTRKKEQRLSLRRGPRKTVSLAYQISEADLSNMWSHSRVWVNQTYAVPDWTKFLRVGSIGMGVTELSFDAVSLGLVASGFAFIYDNNEKYEVRPVKAVTTSKVEFVDPISQAYNDATIVVIELQKHDQPLQLTRTAYGVANADVTWEVLDDTLNASNPFPLYSGIPVVTDPVVMGGTTQSEQFGFDLDRIDNKVGLYTDFQEYGWDSRTRAQLRWSCDTRAEFERVRNFLDFCRGKQGEFWVPSWNTDFILARDIVSSDGALQTVRTAASLFFEPFHVMIEYVDGTLGYTKVTSASRGNDFDTLKVSPVLGDKPMSEVERIMRLNRMRFDTDRFEFQRKSTGVIDIAAPIVSVPEVV